MIADLSTTDYFKAEQSMKRKLVLTSILILSFTGSAIGSEIQWKMSKYLKELGGPHLPGSGSASCFVGAMAVSLAQKSIHDSIRHVSDKHKAQLKKFNEQFIALQKELMKRQNQDSALFERFIKSRNNPLKRNKIQKKLVSLAKTEYNLCQKVNKLTAKTKPLVISTFKAEMEVSLIFSKACMDSINTISVSNKQQFKGTNLMN